MFMKIGNSYGVTATNMPKPSKAPKDEHCRITELNNIFAMEPKERARAIREFSDRNFEEFLNTLDPAGPEHARAVYLSENHGKRVFCRNSLATARTLEESHAWTVFHLNSLGFFNPDLTNGYLNAPQAATGSNQLWVGNGTRMRLNNGISFMFDGEQVFIMRSGKVLAPWDDGFRGVESTAQLANKLRHFANGTLPTKGTMENSFPSHDAARHLRIMGIDPNQDFTVNGVTMRLVDGRIHRV